MSRLQMVLQTRLSSLLTFGWVFYLYIGFWVFGCASADQSSVGNWNVEAWEEMRTLDFGKVEAWEEMRTLDPGKVQS